MKMYTNPGFDAEPLPNNNILFVLPGNGVYEINRNKEIVWFYKTTKVSHDADRLPNGNTLITTAISLVEITQKKEVVWMLSIKETSSQLGFYKAERIVG